MEEREYFKQADFCWLTDINYGCVLRVRDQYRTSCCYAFVVMDTLYASQYRFLSYRPFSDHPIEGSEQEMLDFLHLYYPPQTYRNQNRRQGFGNDMIDAYEFIQNFGVSFAFDRPFMGGHTFPPAGTPHLLLGARIYIDGYTRVRSVNDARSLIQVQPVGASILCPQSFQKWPKIGYPGVGIQTKESIYLGPTPREWHALYEYERRKRNDVPPPFGRHAITIVGYGRANNVQYPDGVFNNVPYFIAKNSWGKSWGYDGYIKIAADIPDPYDSFPFYDYFVMPRGTEIKPSLF